MAFARQRPLRLYQQIARSLERLIADGEFGVGARLPAERDLAERLGVSRTSVREALIALEIAEIVEVRIGSGVYVTALPRDNGPDPIAELAEPGPYEVLEARRLIEGQTAYRAALAATDDQIRSMAECIAAMEAVAVKPRIRGELPGDRSFHLLIAEAAGNSALTGMVRQLWDARKGELWHRWIERNRAQKYRLASVAEHRDILDHIGARRADAARLAMERHIDSLSIRFQDDAAL